MTTSSEPSEEGEQGGVRIATNDAGPKTAPEQLA
jgi:hypothetical protein